ncbi:MAG: DUF3467 domain-containing protein [Paludibacteraceae bacterium]|nr:DUF3467 domain-containing protein [Paludibacteraceae bacterium]
MENDLEKANSVSVELTEDVADGVYSNLVIIAHSSSEFVLDFARIMPSMPKAKVKSRIVLAPEHAKRLLLALQGNIAKYEKVNGTIGKPEQEDVNPKMPFNFGNSGDA